MTLTRPKIHLCIAFSLTLSSCVKYQQGEFSLPENSKKQDNSIPQLNFQSRVFQINPPIIGKIGESLDAESVKARASGVQNQQCAQFEKLVWRANFSRQSTDSKNLFPKDIQNEFDKLQYKKDTNPKIKSRIKLSKNEFSLQRGDFSLYEDNPSPIDVIESLNIFPAEILLQKITRETAVGLTPSMLLRYAKAINDDAHLKITNILSVKKVAGGFYGEGIHSVRDNPCKTKIINGIHFGAALAVAISFRFQDLKDKLEFQKEFGTDNPFSKQRAEFTDLAMSASLNSKKAMIELNVAQIGGSLEETKKFVAQSSCTIEKLEKCRDIQRAILMHFFNHELKAPTSLDQTNGWAAVNFEIFSFAQSVKK